MHLHSSCLGVILPPWLDQPSCLTPLPNRQILTEFLRCLRLCNVNCSLIQSGPWCNLLHLANLCCSCFPLGFCSFLWDIHSLHCPGFLFQALLFHFWEFGSEMELYSFHYPVPYRSPHVHCQRHWIAWHQLSVAVNNAQLWGSHLKRLQTEDTISIIYQCPCIP